MSTRRLFTNGLGAVVALLATTAPLVAQGGTIVGSVRSQDGEPLAGAQVYVIEATENVPTAEPSHGTLTQTSGRYVIPRVPAGEWVVRVELIGYGANSQNVTVEAGETVTASFQLVSEAISLDEIVVTGVSGATVKAKVPFDVTQISTADIPVSAVDAASSIRGKVAGATVYQGSGRPGSAPSILLRGATSINAVGRSQEPLYIVDGVILSSSIVDIDGKDIESIEVVRGAAAASLYGSRAANGVIQITTKRGSTIADDQVRYTIRSEYGANSLAEANIVPTSHFYRMNESQTAFIDGDGNECQFLECGSVLYAGQAAGPGETADVWNSYMTNPWPTTYDQVDRFFQGGDHVENYVSASGRSGATNFHVSFSNLSQGGVMRGFEGFNRNNFRVNIDQSVRDNVQVSASAFYSESDQDQFPEGSGNPLFRLTRQPAGVDLLACEGDPSQSCEDDPENIILITNPFNASESANPVYEMMVEEYKEERDRFLGSVNARWSPMQWLDIDGNASYDRLDRQREDYFPVGYRTVGPNQTLNNGYLYEQNYRSEALNASVTATMSFDLTDAIANRTQLRYLYERDDNWSSTADGFDFIVGGLRTFDNVNPDTYDLGSSASKIRADGYFLITNFDIVDRYIVDALVRNDGSSLFGEDNRRAWYYRVAGAWRLAAEPWFNIPSISEFKLRAAYGTAGNRPRYVAQYETYSVSGGVISPITLGNRNLRPEESAETEVGFDASLLNGRVGLGLTYANTVTTDQILQVPLAAYTGFRRQYQNAGTLESNTWEASLDAVLLRNQRMAWTTRFLFDRTRSEITELTAPAFTYGVDGQNLGNVYYAREGEELGTFYGALIATECAHLPEGTDCSQFQVNDEGLFVYTGGNGFDDPQWGTTGALGNGSSVNWGAPIRGECINQDGQRDSFCQVGKAVPDYHMALSSTFTWGGFQLYGMLDSEQGFDVYNQTAQWAVFRTNSSVCDQTGVPIEEAKPIGYCEGKYFGVGGLQPSNLFVEDGSYVKLREVAARYTFGADQLANVPGLNAFSGITLNVTGRNLVTWTDYRGYDPEIGKAGGDTGSAALARVDGYTYPNFRTWTFGVELNF